MDNAFEGTRITGIPFTYQQLPRSQQAV